MREIWAPIEGTAGEYEVSNTGKVRSNNYNHTKTSKELKQKTDRYGYKCVHYSVNGKRVYSTVHRLVAKAFIPNPNGYPAVNHKDTDKTNNNVSNLEWVTNKQNSEHALQHGLLKNLFEKRDEVLERVKIPVVAINLATGEELIFSSQNEARKKIGSSAHKVILGKAVTCNGYTFYELSDSDEENKRRKKEALLKAASLGGKGARKKKPVIAHNIKTKEEQVFCSAAAAMRGIPDKPCVYDVLSGKIKQSKGYVFHYIEEE